MRTLHALSFVWLLCVVIGSGCSLNGASEVARAKADAEAARAEADSLRSELAKTKAELESAKSESAKAKAADDAVRDLKQARSVAEGFLTAVTTPSVEQLHGFCTAAERQRALSITLPAGKVSWSIDCEALGASGHEATFKGQFESAAGKQPFVVLVIKSADSGRDRWLVDAFSVGS